MTTDIQNILERLKEYEQTADNAGMELRLDLAELVLRGLRRKGWTQGDLAKRADVYQWVVSSIVHSNMSCTFETAGKLLHALGLRVCLCEREN